MNLQNKIEDDFEDFCKKELLSEKNIQPKIQTQEEFEAEHTPAMCLADFDDIFCTVIGEQNG